VSAARFCGVGFLDQNAETMGPIVERVVRSASAAISGAPAERLRPERGAQSPSESERGWGPASVEFGSPGSPALSVTDLSRAFRAGALLVDR